MRYLLTIPAQNEAESIREVISSFHKEADKLDISLNIQVIDDHSTDNTSKVVESIGIPVYPVSLGEGLAATFRTEMQMALETDADCIIHVDADNQYSSSDLGPLITEFKRGFQLVLGNRLSIHPPGMTRLKYEGNLLLSKMVSLIANKKIIDSQTGFRVMDRNILESCPIISEYTYTQEQIIRAALSGFRIYEIPIKFFPRKYGESRLVQNPFQYIARVSEDLERLTKELKLELHEV